MAASGIYMFEYAFDFICIFPYLSNSLQWKLVSKERICKHTSKVLEVSVVEFPVLLLEFEDTVSFLLSLSDFSSELIHSISASKPVGYPIACNTYTNYIKIQFYSKTRNHREEMNYWEQQFQIHNIWIHEILYRKREVVQNPYFYLPGYHHWTAIFNLCHLLAHIK